MRLCRVLSVRDDSETRSWCHQLLHFDNAEVYPDFEGTDIACPSRPWMT
jgi:hypothetical protein